MCVHYVTESLHIVQMSQDMWLLVQIWTDNVAVEMREREEVEERKNSEKKEEKCKWRIWGR